MNADLSYSNDSERIPGWNLIGFCGVHFFDSFAFILTSKPILDIKLDVDFDLQVASRSQQPLSMDIV
ncbi:hypothetical protein DL98DRAFT_523338 [Cadophora sp. DSE1049]|nr:hypothetical protein DL98DRAFT_523338 [Cadophora sp. DSE1049]